MAQSGSTSGIEASWQMAQGDSGKFGGNTITNMNINQVQTQTQTETDTRGWAMGGTDMQFNGWGSTTSFTNYTFGGMGGMGGGGGD